MLLGISFLASACERHPARGDGPVAAGSVAALARPATSIERARLAASALVEIRSRSLSLGAPGETNRHIAFGKGFILQLGRSRATALDGKNGNIIASLSLSSPRAALSVPGGSVLAIAGDTAYRFDPGEQRPHPLGRLLLLPGTLLVPSRESMARVWAFPALGGRVERYEFGADAGIGPALTRPLPDCDGRVVTALSGGDLLCVADRKLLRLSGGVRLSELSLPNEVAAAWRVTPADHIDRTWLATRNGDLHLLELTTRVRVLRTHRTGLVPVDFAATAKRLALLTVVERSGQPRQFRLHVLRYDGSELFSRDVAQEKVTADKDWAAAALRNRELIVREQPPRAAVGGPDAVQLFDAEKGEAIFSH